MDSEPAYKGQLWMVTIDRPYYPSVEYFATEAEALSRAEMLRIESDDGPSATYDVTICVAKIGFAQAVRTDY